MAVTQIATAAAALAWMFAEWMSKGKPIGAGHRLRRRRRPGRHHARRPASSLPSGALVIGIAAGVICFFASTVAEERARLRRLARRLRRAWHRRHRRRDPDRRLRHHDRHRCGRSGRHDRRQRRARCSPSSRAWSSPSSTAGSSPSSFSSCSIKTVSACAYPKRSSATDSISACMAKSFPSGGRPQTLFGLLRNYRPRRRVPLRGRINSGGDVPTPRLAGAPPARARRRAVPPPAPWPGPDGPPSRGRSRGSARGSRRARRRARWLSGFRPASSSSTSAS